MGDLKTPFEKPIYPDTSDLSGDLVVKRGSDPNADGGDGAAGLDPVWTDQQIITTPTGAETPNSVSGLPALPNRFAPPDGPPEMPTLKDRNPGTIDKQ